VKGYAMKNKLTNQSSISREIARNSGVTGDIFKTAERNRFSDDLLQAGFPRK
jgi:hypothetical protein